METKQIISWLYDKAARAMDHSYARMLNMTAKRLRELDEKQRWIPVTERLPEHYESVIGWTKYKERGEVQHDGKHFAWVYDDGEGDYAQVTHWMPLPEPPKEVE